VLAERGHHVVPISRTHGVDVIRGKGLDEALVGVECIVDTATGRSPEQQAATEFFMTATKNLQAQGDVAYVPTMRTQLVAARTVAEALADLAVAPGSAPEWLDLGDR
jgi:hypothetical protein